uniref:Uncharacterized protein n=1 Tax=Cacopsylla melanoneura TaxID=428564 RepID=A0A8D8Q549_9HEMI
MLYSNISFRIAVRFRPFPKGAHLVAHSFDSVRASRVFQSLPVGFHFSLHCNALISSPFGRPSVVRSRAVPVVYVPVESVVRPVFEHSLFHPVALHCSLLLCPLIPFRCVQRLFLCRL